MKYIKIPSEIIYHHTEYGEKRVIMFCYLCSHRALNDTVAFSISSLATWSNMKPNYRDGKINQKYLSVLEKLSIDGYFLEHPDFQKLLSLKSNSTQYQILTINPTKFDTSTDFALISLDEIERILHYNKINTEVKRVHSDHVLLLLAYLRKNMNYNPDKPLCCYRFFQTISDDLELSTNCIKHSLNILSNLDIIKYKECKRIKYYVEKNKTNYYTTPKIFANYSLLLPNEKNIDRSYHWEQEIQKQEELLKKELWHPKAK